MWDKIITMILKLLIIKKDVNHPEEQLGYLIGRLKQKGKNTGNCNWKNVQDT